MQFMTIFPGRDKAGCPENFDEIVMRGGELYTIVGDTGSGKSQLIKDIEQRVSGESVTRRRVTLTGYSEASESAGVIAHLGQNMRFVLDTTVSDFILLHARCRGKKLDTDIVVDMANSITPEPIKKGDNLNLLSGGQSRALMIADIALVCDSPIVLVDEIENAGVNKEKALNLLKSSDKLTLVITHDPHTAMMADKRIVMSGGAITSVIERTATEKEVFRYLEESYRINEEFRIKLRRGEHLA